MLISANVRLYRVKGTIYPIFIWFRVANHEEYVTIEMEFSNIIVVYIKGGY